MVLRDVIGEPGWPGVALLAARNVVLLAATGIAAYGLLRRPVAPQPEPQPLDLAAIAP
ncbi:MULTISPECIES: hypothetical protein [unclassified Solwaraspora]|uniref:hypothetical protein n=1 Tax=unclassified Solwaraspora TaxID=2627926 RepID=UPI00259BC2AE|nr:hypothetical protein [Solwaraspora sp. WMMA2056]WJK38521.1 hypothetical protein O7608_18665 [Solwaraspora sp. WMMA2056]